MTSLGASDLGKRGWKAARGSVTLVRRSGSGVFARSFGASVIEPVGNQTTDQRLGYARG
jgi:hypothetical protein